MSKIKNNKITLLTYISLTLVFAVTLCFLAYRLLFSADKLDSARRTELILMILQCLLGILALQIPSLLEKIWGFDFSSLYILLYHAFLFCAIFLGEIQRYYSKFMLWDDILHLSSGIMTGIFGYMLLSVISRKSRHGQGLLSSPVTVILFAFCFAAALGMLWEIYEFLLDLFFDLNMQKYRLDDGFQLLGHAALTDTMKDIIIDAVGSLIGALTGIAGFRRKPENTMSIKD